MTVLMNAINRNDRKLVAELIKGGTNVDELDANSDAPLVMAAYKGYDEILQMLLEAGADVTAVDPGMKATALHAAAYAGRTEAAKLLVAYHIDINKQGPFNGYTALHDAIWQNRIDIARLLVDAGADLTLRSLDGHSPLDFARLKNRKEIESLIVSRTDDA